MDQVAGCAVCALFCGLLAGCLWMACMIRAIDYRGEIGAGCASCAGSCGVYAVGNMGVMLLRAEMIAGYWCRGESGLAL